MADLTGRPWSVGLLKIGGVCAALYSVGAIAFSFLLLSSTGLSVGEDPAEVLVAMAEAPGVAATLGWLLVVLPILLVIAGLSFFQALRAAGSLMWVSAAAFVGGALLIVYRGFVWLAMTLELAPAYANASQVTRSTLATVAATLESFASMADVVGGLLVAGIGVLLFSLGALRTGLTPKWVTWLGLFVAVVGGWLTPLSPLAELFEILNFLGFAGFWVWMFVMGVFVWRTQETHS